MTEEELKSALEEAQSGNRQAFGLIYDHFSERLYKFIFFRIGHKEVAEDILSDTFVKGWMKIDQATSHKSLSAWLYQVAKNNIIDYYRIKKITVPLEEVENILEDAVNPVDLTDLSFDQKKLVELIRHLPKDQQEVIKYKFFEDLTNPEIAQILNKSEESIRVIQHRAILKLKELLHTKRL